MYRILLLSIISLSLCAGHGQDAIPYINMEIEADGILDEAVWNDLTPFKDFQNFFPINEGKAKFDTDVLVYQDGKYLNFAFIYHDSIPDVRVNSLKRDDYSTGFHLSDCIGLVIDPYNNQNRGYFFSVNGQGTQMDGLIANYDYENLSWDAIWTSGVSTKGNDKIYELQIPLSTFSYDEGISSWSFQFYTRDAKDRMYTVWKKFERGFLQFDTRFLKPIEIEGLSPSKAARTTLIPSLTGSYAEDLLNQEDDLNVQPSLDLQYKISDGLRVDATLNPDFSQVEVDRQVTNLSRFNIIFPERRNFFVENSDMFTTLDLSGEIIPFYSRFIGASQDLSLGLKLSGNVSPNTRVGLLSVQSKKDDLDVAQNYSVASVKQQFGEVVNASGFLVNRQKTAGPDSGSDYNRVLGVRGNYLSKNRKWAGFSSFSDSFSEGVEQETSAFAIENNYTSRGLAFSSRFNTVGRNYTTDIGFVPRLENFNALTGEVIREGYTQLYQSLAVNLFPKNQERIQSFRPISANVSVYLDEDGDVYETNLYYNTALFFTNQMSAYVNLYHDEIHLKYAFDPFRNEEFILPGNYKNSAIRLGYNSDYTKAVFGSVNGQIGSFYGGDRTRFGSTVGYRFAPLLSLELNYEYNTLEFEEIGSEDLHLVQLSTEVFFTNSLNWTTYLQYNEQADNFNLNSRIQWEYRPLSFVYLVFSDNYSESFDHKNWGVSLKINRRLNF